MVVVGAVVVVVGVVVVVVGVVVVVEVGSVVVDVVVVVVADRLENAAAGSITLNSPTSTLTIEIAVTRPRRFHKTFT